MNEWMTGFFIATDNQLKDQNVNSGMIWLNIKFRIILINFRLSLV